jgi:hypothetical protein
MQRLWLACVLTASFALGIGQAMAGPTWAFWNFTNTSGATANDLTLNFTSAVTTNLNQVQNNPMTSATVSGNSVTFNAVNNSQNVPTQGNCPGNFPSCSQDFGMTLLAPGPTALTSANWSVLSGGTPPVVPLPKLFVIEGKAPNGNGMVSITNEDTQYVYFEDVETGTDIDESVLENEDTSSECGNDDLTDCELDATTAQANFSLAPGQTETFMLGADGGPGQDEYTSVIFTDSYDSDFDNSQMVGYAEDVPEPSSLSLFAAALIIGLAKRRRRA